MKRGVKVKKVVNPLTIVGVFCSLAEVFAIYVLPKLDVSLQQYFLWFVMLFPVLLLVLFFITLNLNSTVLYAPSDFKSDEAYLEQLRYKCIKYSVYEKLEQLKEENSKQLTTEEVMNILNESFEDFMEASKYTSAILSEILSAGEKGITAKEISEKCHISRNRVQKELHSFLDSSYVYKLNSKYFMNLGGNNE